MSKTINKAVKSAYDNEEKFKEYLDGYAEGRGISVETAMTHKIAGIVLEAYNERKNNGKCSK